MAMKKLIIYLKILVNVIALSMSSFDCSQHPAFKMYCHENASIANHASWMYDGDVYCQCNGYRFGCDRNKGCELRPYIFSTLSEIPIKMTLNAETSYNFAFAGGMIRKDGRSIWQAFVFEGLKDVEELSYGNCRADMDEIKVPFKKSKNQLLTKEIEPEAFEATCSAEKVEEIQQHYLKASDEFIYFILDSYRIEVYQGGQRKLLVTVPPSDRIISMRIDDPFVYYRTKNHKQEQRKRFDELVPPTEKPCNETSCKFKEIEEESKRNRDDIIDIKSERPNEKKRLNALESQISQMKGILQELGSQNAQLKGEIVRLEKLSFWLVITVMIVGVSLILFAIIFKFCKCSRENFVYQALSSTISRNS